MKEYDKIQTVFFRNPDDNNKTLLEDKWSKPEFELLQNIEWLWTEKIDGTNIRVIFSENTIKFGGKTDNAQIPSTLVNILQNHFFSDLMVSVFSPKSGEAIDVCLYGEGYGNKIQKAGESYIHNGVDFILFDVKIGKWWLEYEKVVKIAESLFIKTVPIIGKGSIKDAIELTKKGFFSQIAEDPSFIAEGLVLKPKVDLFNRNGERVITKIKHKDFK